MSILQIGAHKVQGVRDASIHPLSLFEIDIYSGSNRDSDVDHILWRKYSLVFPLMSSSCSWETRCGVEFPDEQIAFLVAEDTTDCYQMYL